MKFNILPIDQWFSTCVARNFLKNIRSLLYKFCKGFQVCRRREKVEKQCHRFFMAVSYISNRVGYTESQYLQTIFTCTAKSTRIFW